MPMPDCENEDAAGEENVSSEEGLRHEGREEEGRGGRGRRRHDGEENGQGKGSGQEVVSMVISANFFGAGKTRLT